MIFCGIDPGNQGALCYIDEDRRVLKFYDTPLLTVETRKTKRKVMNAQAARMLLEGIIEMRGTEVVYAVIEKVAPMPSLHEEDKGAKMGATSAFNYGKGVGIWIGLLVGLQIPFTEVHPMTWKASLMRDSAKGKGASILKATQLYPSSAKDLTRIKDHGRADALLLAEWGRRSLGGKRIEEAPGPQQQTMFG